LVLQKRRRLGEKDTKGTERGVWDGVTGVRPLFALIRQLSEPSVQEGLESIKASPSKVLVFCSNFDPP